MKRHFWIKFLLIFLLLFIAGCSPQYANTWRKIYGYSGSEMVTHMEKTHDGKYILAGMTNSKGAGQDDFYILKMDSWGNILWEITYGGENDDTANCIKETKDGGYIVVGESYSFGTGISKDMYVLKLNSKAEVVWGKNFGGKDVDGGRWVEETSDGNFVVVGWTRSFGGGASDFYVLKLDKDGEILWSKTWGGSNFEEASSVVEAEDGGYLVAGFTMSYGAGSKDVALVKFDSNGNILWYKTYGGTKDDTASNIIKTKDGNYVILGYTASFGTGGDVCLLKVDPSGNILWEKYYGGEGSDSGKEIRQTSDEGFIAVGTTKSFGVMENAVYLLKIDPLGNLQWERIFEGEDIDEGNTVLEIPDGYLVGGWTRSFGSVLADILILKLDAEGNL